MRNDLYINRSRYSRGRRRRGRGSEWLPYALLILLLLLLLSIAGWLFLKNRNSGIPDDIHSETSDSGVPGSGFFSFGDSAPENESSGENQEEDSLESYLEKASLLAAGYDYDSAVTLLTNSPYAETPEAISAVTEYNAVKETLVRADPTKVTHVFFHTLIMDNSKAFDGDRKEKGYNQVMTTKDEFLKILQSMYDRGFVLVRLHDIAYETTDENGSPKFTAGDIMLPPGKQPFVMSQDDVCYYEYMEGDGFASRMVIGENGTPVCEMKLDDGSVAVGSYDLVPLLDDFIEEHPDFSYKGARAVIAFTGYNGILGYRTAPSYDTEEYKAAHPDFDYEKEREEAAKVAECLKANGYELASHSWGHRNMGEISMENFRTDTDKWETEVESLTGECDIILFPFGSDIGDWRPYDTSGERFQYLYQKGFRYFCNVDSAQYWVQIGDTFMRQGRRNLDGYRMYYDLPESGVGGEHLSDLFDVREVFDWSRPLPVPGMAE